ncbi:MAG: hypothetical protein N2110_04290 [Flavobacteriales bacterium]|nr:hypothetical protein [Flavobacteriales bacterium]MCX7768229.1 hypothetical protein [Flavobacteriales bacterium]MDW8410134.1 hypothetical protein [Flavobacteriales bacterium]
MGCPLRAGGRWAGLRPGRPAVVTGPQGLGCSGLRKRFGNPCLRAQSPRQGSAGLRSPSASLTQTETILTFMDPLMNEDLTVFGN